MRYTGRRGEFFRNAALDERNRFAPVEETPRYQQNQYGFSIGGPVAKDRTFFFGDMKGGGLAKASRGLRTFQRRSNAPAILKSAAPPVDLFTQQPFPGNRIPAGRIHPVGAAIANLYPLPDRDTPGQNYISSPVLRDPTRHFDTRLDHRFGDASDFALRYSCADRLLFEPFSRSLICTRAGFRDPYTRGALRM